MTTFHFLHTFSFCNRFHVLAEVHSRLDYSKITKRIKSINYLLQKNYKGSSNMNGKYEMASVIYIIIRCGMGREFHQIRVPGHYYLAGSGY